MNVLISGRADLAAFREGGKWLCFSSEEPDRIEELAPTRLRSLHADFDDLETHDCRDLDSARLILEGAWRRQSALPLALIVLDVDSHSNVRLEAVAALNELLAEEGPSRAVRDRLYSAVLPAGTRLLEAREATAAKRAVHVGALLDDLIRLQEPIRTRRNAWDAQAFDLVGDNAAKERLRIGLCDLGYWRRLVESFNNRATYDLVLMEMFQPYTEVRIKQRARLDGRVVLKGIITGWTDTARPTRLSPVQQAALHDGHHEERETGFHQRDRQQKRLRADEALAKVNSQQALIEVLWRKGEMDRAERVLLQLITHQQQSSKDNSYLAKTLSKLAMVALDIVGIAKSIELTTKAVEIAPDDPVALSQLAARLLTHSKFDEALTLYVTVINAFPFNVIARSGRAEVLKAMGRMDEALIAYEQVVKDFPANVVARTGRAEVLKTMGRMDEALSAYEQAVKGFPANVVARTGRAEVLKAMGRMDEALIAYEQVAKDFPANVVALSGRAEVFKVMGRMDEALIAYEQVVKDFPADGVARNGRAEVLKAMGRMDEALIAYEQVVKDFPANVVARNGRAEVLKAMGRMDEALSAYEQAVKNFPANVVARTGRAEVLKAMGRMNEALSAYEQAVKDFPANGFARNCLMSCYVLMGCYEKAIKLFPIPSDPTCHRSAHDWVATHILGMAQLRRGDLDQATQVFQSGIQYCPLMESRRYFEASLAVTLIRQRQWEQARIAIGRDQSDAGRVLRMHILSECRPLEEAREVLATLVRSKEPLLAHARDAVAQRYQLVPSLGPIPTDTDVFEAEIRLLLRAA